MPRFLTAAAVAGLFALAIGAAGSLYPEADLFNLLWLPALVLVLACAAGLAITGGRGWRSRPAALVLAGLAVLAGWRDPVERAPACDLADADLRLVSSNLLGDNRTPAAAAAWIRSRRPDVVMLAEADKRSTIVPVLVSRDLPHAIDCHARGRCPTWIMAREQPLALQPLARGDPKNRGGLMAALLTVEHAGRPFHILAVHLSRPWPFGRQVAEFRALARVVRDLGPERVLVVGDLNAALPMRVLADFYRDSGLRPAIARGGTWPLRVDGLRTLPLITIDHVAMGGGFAVASLRRGPDIGSDHSPLETRLCLAGA